MTLQELWSRRAAKPVADTFVSLRDTLGLRPHHARVAHGICGIISTCSRADQYTGMTAERYNRKLTRLSAGNGARQYGTDGRGWLTPRLWLQAACRRDRRRDQGILHQKRQYTASRQRTGQAGIALTHRRHGWPSRSKWTVWYYYEYYSLDGHGIYIRMAMRFLGACVSQTDRRTTTEVFAMLFDCVGTYCMHT